VPFPSRALRRVAVAVLAAAPAVSPLATPAAAGPSPPHAAQLPTIQRNLHAVTLPIQVRTAMWMALVRTVHGRQADLRHATALIRRTARQAGSASGALRSIRARIRVDRRVLGRLLPGWLRIKAALHADYRRVKALLAESRRVVRAVLGPNPGRGSPGPWLAAWPVAIHQGSTLQACPVAGPISLTDSFGAPRPGGRFHEGNDLLAARGTPELAVQPGVVIPDPNTLGGRAVILRSASGYSYYAHLSSYGATGSVPAGAVIGYVGASGDAKGLIPHLHYEWHSGGGPAVDPFPLLQAVCP
jgi:murein DD-endopeptidase MepM/ murein hydrolase activator NlpD